MPSRQGQKSFGESGWIDVRANPGWVEDWKA
jgi:hypothetical protein